MYITSTAIAGALAFVQLAKATHLTDKRLDKVKDVMLQTSTASWENGTVTQALLESGHEHLSVYSPNALFPLPDFDPDDISDVIDYARVTMQNRQPANLSSHGGQSLLEDGAAGDPASLGIAVLLANITTNNEKVKDTGYGDAAKAELNYLLYDVPRVSYYGLTCTLQSDFRHPMAPSATAHRKRNYGRTACTWLVTFCASFETSEMCAETRYLLSWRSTAPCMEIRPYCKKRIISASTTGRN